MGHEAPFAFDLDYRPAPGIERMRVGTPPVIALAALEAALDVWDEVDIADLRRRSIELSERFIAGVERVCPELELASPRDALERGSQVSFRHARGYPVMQALIAKGVIGDFRAPDCLRFGFAPLYLGEEEIDRAVATLSEVLDGRLWDQPEFHRRAAVT
jgi:kynureninase